MPFSVLMSLYHKERPEFLRQSLDSVFGQTMAPDEVVLVEDGPLTKELYDVLCEYESRYPQLKRVPLKVNQGLGKALNEGLKHCSHDLVARMDTDDVAVRERFAEQVVLMHEHSDIAVCSSWIEEFIGETSNVSAVKKLPENHEEIYAYAKRRCPINHPAVIYRRSAVMSSGGYGPFPEDYYLWGKMLKDGCRFHNIAKSLLLFRSSDDVYKRRGGWNYFIAMFRLQRFLYHIGFLSLGEYMYNTSIRSVVSLVPNWMRKQIYTRFLRK